MQFLPKNTLATWTGITLMMILSVSLNAQNARITLKMPKKSGYAISLVAEKLRYYDSPAIGLTDVEYQNFGVFDDSTKAWAIAELPLSEPQLVHLNFTDAGPTMGQSAGSPNRLLFISPGDKLTIPKNSCATVSKKIITNTCHCLAIGPCAWTIRACCPKLTASKRPV
jgi:hypothetical protein